MSLDHPVFRAWRADMAWAREARIAGDRQMAAIGLRRARIARRWIGEDLAGYRRQWGISLLEARPLRSLAAPETLGPRIGLVIRPKRPKRRR